MAQTEQAAMFREFIHRPKRAHARELMDNEVVHCYNGVRIGQKGDFVVMDEEYRTMIVRRDRFMNNYVEVTNETVPE